MPIVYPSLAEQKKIGEFLTRLDETVTLHQREYDELVELKKGLLQKMFI
jgi:type I restriction enzyme S subunit